MHGHRLSSEEICNEYAAQTIACQSQAFPIENSQKKANVVWVLWFSKARNGIEKSNKN